MRRQVVQMARMLAVMLAMAAWLHGSAALAVIPQAAPQPYAVARGVAPMESLGTPRSAPVVEVAHAAQPDAPWAASLAEAHPAGTDDDTLETQGFEGDFPPDGWETYEDLALTGQAQERVHWAAQDIDVPPGGGVKAAWSIGGGPVGSTIGFGGTYTQPVASMLTFGPIDTRPYAEGLSVQMLFKADVPRRTGAPNDPTQAKTFLICADRNDSDTLLACRTLGDEDAARNRWLRWQEPLVFEQAGGLEEARVYVVHRDLFPTGSHTGVNVDQIEIVGLTASDPGPTPVPTGGPSPMPTATRLPPGPVPSDPRRAFLPMTMRNAVKADFPSELEKPQPGTVTIDFGTAIDAETGALTNPGTEFSPDVQQLCARQRWQGVPVGTPFRVQWYVEEGGHFVELDPDNAIGVNDSFDVRAETGFAFQCIGYADSSGNPIPVPQGRYRNSVFLRGEDVASASRTAAVRPGSGPTPPPAATATNPPPGQTATPPPGATPKPTLPAGCVDPLINGDFEQGPSVGWQQQSNNNVPSIRSEGALDSDFGVFFGGYAGAREAVLSLVEVDTFSPSEVSSVAVRWMLNVRSQENRTVGDAADDHDNFIVGVQGDTSDDARPMVRISEDSAAPDTSTPFRSDTWYSLRADITQAYLTGDGFSTAQLILLGILDADDLLTNFRVDNVSLEICTDEGALHHVPLRPAVQQRPVTFDPTTWAAWLREAPLAEPRVIGSRPAVGLAGVQLGLRVLRSPSYGAPPDAWPPSMPR